VGVELCRVNAEVIQIITRQLVPDDLATRIAVVASRRSAADDQKKLAVRVTRQLCSYKAIKLCKELCINSSVGDNK
jgi:hypothetical protein